MILPILSGILLAVSMPGPNLGWLAWIALIPLFWALHNKTPKESFKIGFIAGIVYFGALLYWLFTLWEWAGPAIIPGYLVLIAYLALYWGAFGAGASWLSARLPRWALIVAIPAFWVILEFIRSQTRFGFPWGQAADALFQQLPFVQVASATGIWGVSFLVVLFNYLIITGLRARQWPYPVFALVMMAGLFAWGSTQINQPVSTETSLNLALVQPNIGQRERSNPTKLNEFLAIYTDLLGEVKALPQKADLVVLPESSLPAFVLEDPTPRDFFSNWTSAAQTHLVLGTFTSSSGGTEIFNSTAYFTPNGPAKETYSKVQLVPFSTEYFPGIQLLNSLGLSTLIPAGSRLGLLTPGRGFFPLKTELGLIATPICFESIFPEVSREFVRNGAELILVVTNDAWFKNSWALDQHFAKGVFRAVENGRYFVQTANSGISGIIDPHGKIQERSSIENRSITTGRVSLLDGETLFTRFGDWFIYLLLIALLMSVVISVLQGARSPSPAS
ncbi:apolipoprotein N-acyltransferase [Candidatus Acetothermia bacterium]|nr:apolipoprotein N-acyltransferase [Candidatus Acetothermia bacterium]MBI3642732.1 apolipoprotein N-acyltransferase [Candidatus Acetothermia bacterium]